MFNLDASDVWENDWNVKLFFEGLEGRFILILLKVYYVYILRKVIFLILIASSILSLVMGTISFTFYKSNANIASSKALHFCLKDSILYTTSLICY